MSLTSCLSPVWSDPIRCVGKVFRDHRPCTQPRRSPWGRTTQTVTHHRREAASGVDAARHTGAGSENRSRERRTPRGKAQQAGPGLGSELGVKAQGPPLPHFLHPTPRPAWPSRAPCPGTEGQLSKFVAYGVPYALEGIVTPPPRREN